MAVNAPSSPLPGASVQRSGNYLKISPGTSLTSQWHIKTRVTPADQVLAAACGLSPVTAAILRARGYNSAEAVKRFLNPSTDSIHDPQQLPDIGLAVERLHRAITSHEPMLVFGDYDVDGVTSTALLLRSLQRLKANVSATIPERTDGYGLSVAAVEKAAAKGFTLILTADCGIRSHQPIERARELGIDVVVTDHHEPGETLPPAVAVVNPKRHDSHYGFRELCGCAVAFKVLQALLETHWPRAVDSFYEKYIELVALATIADCMPLVDENRVLTREGLDRLGGTNKAGLRALMKIARIEPGKTTVSGRQVGFGLAPRINSAGRFNVAHKSLDLMLSNDAAASERLAAELEDHNKQRQATTMRMFGEAMSLVQREADVTRDCALVVAGTDWPRGMVGLVASRLVEKYARPAIVLGIENGLAHGSGRSIEQFDMSRLLDDTRSLLIGGGGHAGACGVHLEEGQIQPFRAAVLEHTARELDIGKLRPKVEADCEIDERDLDERLVHDLKKLEPCGKGNEEPLLALLGVRIVDGKSMGPEGQHLKWRIQTGNSCFEAVWWRPGEKAMGFGIGKTVDICFVPELNYWNGNTTLQLVIKEARLVS